LDTGPMLLAESLPIMAATTAGQLHDALSALGARLVVAALDGLMRGSLTPVVQPQEGVTYAHKLGKDEGLFDWRRPAAELERAVRALNPWPGTFFEIENGERIKVLEAQLAAGSGPPGTVLKADDALSVACGSGALRMHRLQRPGRAPMAAGDFLRGFALAPGTRLKLGNVVRLHQP
jgi:methionyl-tRNA formyltransferase